MKVFFCCNPRCAAAAAAVDQKVWLYIDLDPYLWVFDFVSCSGSAVVVVGSAAFAVAVLDLLCGSAEKILASACYPNFVSFSQHEGKLDNFAFQKSEKMAEMQHNIEH